MTAGYEQIPYRLKVRSGSGSGTYHSKDQVVIKADKPKSGYRFKSWTITSGGGSIASKKESQTTFTMPAEDVEISAVYELIPYILTVKNGTGSGSYTKDTDVDIVPNFPVERNLTDGKRPAETYPWRMRRNTMRELR